jgi:energy-coupling factor transporter transmembrane protein EcfT
MIDQRVKLVVSLFFACVALTCPVAVRVGSIFLTFGLFAFAAPFGPHSAGARLFLKRFILYSLALTLAVLLLNSLLIPNGAVLFALGPVKLFSEGLWFGIELLSRLLLLSFGFLLYFASTPLRDFATLLQSSKIPPQVASIVLLSLYFIEEIPGRIEMIHAAQESRGAALRGSVVARARAFISLLSPLIVSSLIESIQRGTTLELRGSLLDPIHRSQIMPLDLFSRFLLLIFVVAAVILVMWRLFYAT